MAKRATKTGMSRRQIAGWSAFKKDLPTLLTTHKGQWVAYHGRRRVAMAASKQALYQELGTKYPLGELVVCQVAPLGPPVDLSRPRRVVRD